MLLAGPLEVGVAAAGWYTLETVVEPLPSASSASPLQPGDVVVLSGGARGVTAEVAVALAQAFSPTLVLLGRSPQPQPEPEWLVPLSSEAEIKRELGSRANGNTSLKHISDEYQALAVQREIRTTLARLQVAGSRALYRSVDIRDTQTVAGVLASVRQELGPVRGLIHGAGVLADARIEDKTAEQFDRVYRTKVAGLRNLLAAVNPDDLRTLVLFSSSTGRFGRVGQADYAMANEVLNKLAQQQARHLPRCRVVSVNWGPWNGGMVTPALKSLFAHEGIGVMERAAAAHYLVQELRQGTDRAVEVVVMAPGSREPAAPPLAPAPARTLPIAFERILDRAGHPLLEAHVLDGRPVLPLVLTLEWLAHAAMHQNPGLVFHGCDDLRIFHRVALEGESAPRLRVCAGKAVKSDGLYVAAVELRSAQPDGSEILHARAEILLALQLPPAPPPRTAPVTGPYPHTRADVYQDLLFHGPEFQGLELVDGCGEQGIVGVARTAPPPADWIRQPLRQKWLTDPLVLDTSLQMMILWTVDQCGSPSLPCRVTRYRQFQRGFPPSEVRVVIHVTRAAGRQAMADIDYLDGEGRLIARLEGYECVLDPALTRAFRRNRLAPAARS
jgi:NAD(P)-dependent dehydrogenase (short-subunit alcohol dehydrogenase family)